jgi:glycosyltransferase involved in cell wall biosynthesis
MRILLTSCYFPPSNTIGAVRTGKTAKYLLRHGHDVRVLTCTDLWYFTNGAPVEIDENRILRFPASPPFDRLRSSLRTLRAALRRRPSHLPPPAQASAASAVAPPPSSTLRRHVAALLNRPDAVAGWTQHALRGVETSLRGWRPDIVYGSCSPPSSLITAQKLAQRWGVPFVAEFRDLWADNADYAYPPWRRRIDDLHERRLLRTAGGIVTVSGPLADVLRAKYPQPVEVITNGFDHEDYPPGRYSPVSADPLHIVYTGKVYQGKQDPAPLFEAMSRVPNVRLTLVGYHNEWLQPMVHAAQLSSRVTFQPMVPLQESIRMQQEADILLLMLWTDTSQKGITTGKIFEYIGAARPILAIGPGGDVPSAIIRENALGVSAQNTEQVVTALTQWAEAKRRGVLEAPSPADTRRFTREEQTLRLEHFLEKVMHHRP